MIVYYNLLAVCKFYSIIVAKYEIKSDMLKKMAIELEGVYKMFSHRNLFQ